MKKRSALRIWSRRRSPASPRCLSISTIKTGVLIAFGACAFGATDAERGVAEERDCPGETTVASGKPDGSLLAPEASEGIRATWCERYDDHGIATRFGAYREFYPNGRLRVSGRYVDSRLEGPILIRHADGSPFLQGFLDSGEWSGDVEIYHPNGVVWFEGRFEAGVLEGPVRTHYDDGALASETKYQRGREDGLARTFYPTWLGGRLKSEAHIEADEFVGVHRLQAPDGKLKRSIDWSDGPPVWRPRSDAPRASQPASLGITSGATPAQDDPAASARPSDPAKAPRRD